jgi:hypothetical protein
MRNFREHLRSCRNVPLLLTSVIEPPASSFPPEAPRSLSKRLRELGKENGGDPPGGLGAL